MTRVPAVEVGACHLEHVVAGIDAETGTRYAVPARGRMRPVPVPISSSRCAPSVSNKRTSSRSTRPALHRKVAFAVPTFRAPIKEALGRPAASIANGCQALAVEAELFVLGWQHPAQ